MNKVNKPQGASDNKINPDGPYVGLFKNNGTDSYNVLYEKERGKFPPFEIRFRGHASYRCLCNAAFDFEYDRGRGRYANARAIHLAPKAPSYDIYLDDKLLFSKLHYLMQTNYLKIRPGNHRISVYHSGQIRQPILTKQVFTTGRSVVSIVVHGLHNRTDIMVINDKTNLHPGVAKVRLIQLSADTPAIDLLAGRTVWFYQVMFREETACLTLLPVRESLSVRLSENRQIVLAVPNVQFQRNRSYTIYITGLLKGSPPLQLFIVENGSWKIASICDGHGKLNLPQA